MIPEKISQLCCSDIVSDTMHELNASRSDLYFTEPAAPDDITLAAEMTGKGMIPIFFVSSEFLQKAYYQIIHDICRKRVPAVFIVVQEKAGSSILDLSSLSVIPDMTLLAPKNRWELADMLRWAVDADGPAAIFCPEEDVCSDFHDFCAVVGRGKSEIMYDEGDIALIAVGNMVETAAAVRKRLKEFGYGCSLINARFMRPLDEEMLLRTVSSHSLIVTLEENVRCGGFGDRVLEYLNDIGRTVRVISIAVPDDFSVPEDMQSLEKEAMLDGDSILMRILAEYAGRSDQF